MGEKASRMSTVKVQGAAGQSSGRTDSCPHTRNEGGKAEGRVGGRRHR